MLSPENHVKYPSCCLNKKKGNVYFTRVFFLDKDKNLNYQILNVHKESLFGFRTYDFIKAFILIYQSSMYIKVKEIFQYILDGYSLRQLGANMYFHFHPFC